MDLFVVAYIGWFIVAVCIYYLLMMDNYNLKDAKHFVKYYSIENIQPKSFTRIVFSGLNQGKVRGRTNQFGQVITKNEVLKYSDIKKWRYSFKPL